MVDNKTTYLQLKLPSSNNLLSEDCVRISENFSDIDQFASSTVQRISELETNVSTTINNSITTIDNSLQEKANDNSVVKLTGNQTVKGTKTFTSPIYGSIYKPQTNGELVTLVNGQMGGGSDYFRIACGGTDDSGWVELATADNGNEPIYVRQYAGTSTGSGYNFNENATIKREAILLDSSGNTSFPGTVTASTFSGALSGNASTATKLKTARTIGGVSFDGSANINLPGVNTTGNQAIAKAQAGSSWIKGRDTAILKNTTAAGSNWAAIGSCKTTSGSWEFGAINEQFVLSYATDTNYSANTNNTVRFTFNSSGLIDGNKKVVNVNIGTSWTGSAVPFTQNITVTGATANSVILISLSTSATSTQVTQYNQLGWTPGGQTTNQITLKCWGTKNTANIPITVTVM